MTALSPQDWDEVMAAARGPAPAAGPSAPLSPADWDEAMADARTWAGGATELVKGVPAGAAGVVGSAVQSMSARRYGPPPTYLDLLDRIEASAGLEQADRERLVRDIFVPQDPDLASWIGGGGAPSISSHASELNVARRLAERGDTSAVQRLRRRAVEQTPGPVAQRPLWQAGEAISRGGDLFPASPGYRDAPLRILGEGLGSTAAFVAVGAVPVAGGPLSLTLGALAGSGEAAQRAVRAGATDEQIGRAAVLGLAAGSTEALPVQTLLGRLPVLRAIGRTARRMGAPRALNALARIGGQALIEAAQEGGQEAAQNLIAREVHSPEQQIFSGVLAAAALGGGVGGIMGAGREAVLALASRRSGSQRGERAAAQAAAGAEPPSPADTASPIPTEAIQAGRAEILDGQATAAADAALADGGFPPVGTPVRLQAGGDSVEGVITDGWGGDDPGVSVTRLNGEVIDISAADIAASGGEVIALPLPAPRAEIDAAAKRVQTAAAREAEQAERGAADEPTARPGGGAPPTPPDATRGGAAEAERGPPPPPTPLAPIPAPVTSSPPAGPSPQSSATGAAGVPAGAEQRPLLPASGIGTPAETADSAGRPAGGIGLPQATPSPATLAGGVVEVPVAALETDAEQFQYKEGGDASGVTERLRGVQRWDAAKAGVALVWERRDGRLFVADGHQRLGLARRLGAPAMLARVFREADGVTAADMRREAALKNIAEGTGSAWDAATVLRDSPDPEDDLAGLPPNSALVRDARGLAQLDAELFAAAKADPEANPGLWAVVGEVGAGDRPLQDLLAQQFRARKPRSRREAELLARMIAADRVADASQESLFGPEALAQSLYAERAQIVDGAIRRLSRDRRVFASLDRNAAQIEAAGNRLTAENEAIAAEAGRVGTLIERLALSRGPVGLALRRAAEALAEGEARPSEAVDRFVDAVRAWDANETARHAAANEDIEPDEAAAERAGQASMLGEEAAEFGEEAAPLRAEILPPRWQQAIQRTELVEIEQIAVGLTYARTPAQAAHFFAPFRKEPAETALALVLDGEDRALGVVRHSIGGTGQVNVEMMQLLGAVARVPGAQRFFLGHNHPSGSVRQSRPDLQVARLMESATRGTALKFAGSVVVAPGAREFTFRPDVDRFEKETFRGAVVTAARKRRLPVFGRRLTLTAPDRRIPVRSDEAIEAAIPHFLPLKSGILLTNAQAELIGAVSMDNAGMSNLREGGGAADIWRRASEVNASKMIVVARSDRPARDGRPGDPSAKDAVSNMFSFAGAMTGSDKSQAGAVLAAVTVDGDGEINGIVEPTSMWARDVEWGPFFQRSRPGLAFPGMRAKAGAYRAAEEAGHAEHQAWQALRAAKDAGAPQAEIDRLQAAHAAANELRRRSNDRAFKARRAAHADSSRRNARNAAKFVAAVEERGLIAHTDRDRGGSVYVTVHRPNLTKAGRPSKIRPSSPLIDSTSRTLVREEFKARFSDHGQYYGATISVDPVANNTVADAVKVLDFILDPTGKERPVIGYSTISPEAGVERRIRAPLGRKHSAEAEAEPWRAVGALAQRARSSVTEQFPGISPEGREWIDNRPDQPASNIGSRELEYAPTGAQIRSWFPPGSAIPTRREISAAVERVVTDRKRLRQRNERQQMEQRRESHLRSLNLPAWTEPEILADWRVNRAERGRGEYPGQISDVIEAASKAVRERILELGFQPSEVSRSLKSMGMYGDSHYISVVTEENLGSPPLRFRISDHYANPDKRAREVSLILSEPLGPQVDWALAPYMGSRLYGRGPRAPQVRVTRRFSERQAEVERAIRRVGRESFGANFRVEVWSDITTPEGDAATGAFNPVTRTAYIALRSDEPGMQNTLYHEGLHYLRAAGAFSDGEGQPTAAWRALERQARERWMDDYGIRRRYAGDAAATGRGEDLLIEEAVAEALGDFAIRGRETGFGPTVRAALNRILRFFRALRQALRGEGFQTWEGVFEGIEGGRFAPDAAGGGKDAMDRHLQRAYAGAQVDFDRFDTAFIGSQEDTAGQGWGLYFSGRKAVADWYRKSYNEEPPQLPESERARLQDKKTWTPFDPDKPGTPGVAMSDAEDVADTISEEMKEKDEEWERDFQFERDEHMETMGDESLDESSFEEEYEMSNPRPTFGLKDLNDTADAMNRSAEIYDIDHLHGILIFSDGSVLRYPKFDAEYFEIEQGNALATTRDLKFTYSGVTYQVDLAPTDNELLNWNLPFDEQPESVQRMMREAWNETFPDKDESLDLSIPLGEQDLDVMEIARVAWINLIDYNNSLNNQSEFVRGLLEKREWRPSENMNWDLPIQYQSNEVIQWVRGAVFKAWKDLLNWNATLDQHPIIMKDAIQERFNKLKLSRRKVINNDDSGKKIYQTMAGKLGSKEAASKVLLKHGIRGNKYRSKTSWEMGEEYFNYVIFDADDITIEEKLFQRDRLRGGGRLGEFDTEPGAEGIDQAVLPGAARLSAGETRRAQETDRRRTLDLVREASGERAAARVEREQSMLRSPRAQKPADEGLFAPPQGTLFQRAPAPDTAAFRQWFGDSKAVDPDGKPTRILVGTPNDFTEFSGGFGRMETPEDLYGKIGGIFWGTDNPETASAFADATEFGGEPDRPSERAPRLMPVFMALRNPLIVDAQGRRWSQIQRSALPSGFTGRKRVTTDAVVEWAAEHDHDGVIVRNVVETDDIDLPPSTTYVAFWPEQIKSAIGNRGTFDANSPNILFQRADNEFEAGNDKGFDEAASRYAGVDLAGAAAAVRKDREQMGGIEDALRAFALGPNAVRPANVEVEQTLDEKDMNFIAQVVLPPLSATRRFPPFRQLVREGIDGEKNLSNWIRRLGDRWNAITRRLKKPEFAELTGLLFLGDAEAHVFTDADLDAMEVRPAVRTAYRRSRQLLDQLGTMAENHNRRMALKLIQRKNELLKRMAGGRNIDLAAFRTAWNERAALLAEQRRAESDPEALAERIEAATARLLGRDLFGQQPLDDKMVSMLEEADRLQTRIDDGKVKRRVGYVPHKFFGRWRVHRSAGADRDGNPIWEEVAGEHGFWPTRTDAVRAASHIAKKDPNAQLRVSQVEFIFPENQATQLSDAGYFRFRNNVGKLLDLQGDALQEAVTGAARRRFRRRIAGFAQYRKGVEGYSRDLDRVMRRHIGETVRYIVMDRLKFDAINLMEKHGLSEGRSKNQNYPVLQRFMQQWWRDVNGEKQVVEEQIDALFDKDWMSPLKAGLAAGGAAFVLNGGIVSGALAAGGATVTIGSVAVPLAVASYMGFMVGRAVYRGGTFKSRAMTGAALGAMSHLKLGMAFNLFSPLVNLLQTATNTYPVLGRKYTAIGIKRFTRAVNSKMLGRPNADWRQLERNNIKPLANFAEGTIHQFQKEGVLPKVSMALFTGVETFNRGVAYLGAYSRAEDAGKSPKLARADGNAVMDRTQLNYETAAKPQLLRNNFLRVPLQFKNFVLQQLGFVFSLRRAEIPRFLLSMALLAGALGLPFLDIADLAMEPLGFSPILAMKEQAIDSLADGELQGGMMTLLTRGLPGLAGVDLTSRVGMGDKFLPTQLRDMEGPWLSTVKNALHLGEINAKLTDQIRNVSPGLGNPLKALESAMNGGIVTNPWKRNFLEYNATPGQLLLKAAGGRPIEEARLHDLRDIERRDMEKRGKHQRRYYDLIADAHDAGDRAEVVRLIREARERGVRLTQDGVRRTLQGQHRDRSLRSLLQLPRDLRAEGLRRREAIAAQ